MPRHHPLDGLDAARRVGFGAVALWLLSGCAALQPGGTVPGEADVPATWSAAAAAPRAMSLADWWQRFGDPTLAQLVADAMQANTGVLAAQAGLRQARALRDVASAGLRPTLGSSASAQHGTRGGDSTGNSFQLGLDASWELDVFGANRSALATSQAAARASAASLGDVQVSIAAEVALNYIALRAAQARLAIASDNLASQLQTLQLTEWRVQAGLLSALEAEQARAAAAQVRAQIPGLQTSIEQAAHALAVLTGRPPAALAALVAAPRAVPQAAGTLALAIPAETLRQRPDVRAAEQQVLAAQGRVAQADAARYPSFRLGGSLGLNALTLGALGHSAAVVTSLLGSVSLPLFDGGAARAQVSAQQAALDQARASYRGTVLTALQHVEDALVALRGDLEREARLQQAAQAATQSATLARQRFSSGLIDFQTVLETQRSQLGAQDSLASAGADVSADHVRLFKALGGGWRPDEDSGDRRPDEDVTPTPSTETRPAP
ncbi:MAG: efflux transporter outer membrane subunit [Rubrivivax sp.]|nr:efflux transporter outer membrane subunit [Rubrivivax sp.]